MALHQLLCLNDPASAHFEVLPYVLISAIHIVIAFIFVTLLVAQNPAGQSIRVVDDLYTANLSAAVGLPYRLGIGLQAPVNFFEQGTNFNTQNSFRTASFGDLLLEFKWNPILETSWGPGIALVNRVTFPTGEEDKFTGFSSVSYEGKLVVDKKVHWFTMVANVGYQTFKKTIVAGITMDDRMTFGGGVSCTLPFSDRSWDLLGEVDGYSVVSDRKKITTPLEWLVGMRKRFNNEMTLQVGAGRGITGGVGGGEWRIVGGLSYPFPLTKAAREKKRVLETSVPLETIFFRFNHDQFLPKYYSLLDRVVTQWKGIPRATILLKGYADGEGDPEYNVFLSAERAKNVARVFMERGVPASQIHIEALGEENPRADNQTFEGKAQNRRVEIFLLVP